MEIFKGFSDDWVQQSLLSSSLNSLANSLAENSRSGDSHSDTTTEFSSVSDEQIIDTLLLQGRRRVVVVPSVQTL